MRVQVHSLALTALLVSTGCGSGNSEPSAPTGGTTGMGGATSTGGLSPATGGVPGSGGTPASGGTPSSGGATTGGSPASGGATTGGSPASGGALGVGGATTGGTVATGGAAQTGGTPATGGVGETGGDSPAGGTAGSAGAAATGGTPTPGGAPATGGDAPGGAVATGGETAGGAGGGGDTGGASTGGASTGDAVPSDGCGHARTLQDGNLTLSSGGQNRQYYLKTPSGYDNTHPYRLIFMFHWYYGSINAVVNPPDADHNTDEPFYGLGDVAGDSTIFVVPQGLTDSGGAGWANPNNRDVNFTDDMLTAITNDLCVDTSRVFTTGFSYGGAISYKLACARAEKFRAAIVYDTGPISGNNEAECTTPIAFFESHGVDDQTFNYQTGLSVLDIFVKVNGCTPLTPPTPPQDGHTCTSFEGCSVGHPVRFCNFGAGENNPYNSSLHGHYPSPKDPGQSTSWVPGEVWEFIQQF